MTYQRVASRWTIGAVCTALLLLACAAMLSIVQDLPAQEQAQETKTASIPAPKAVSKQETFALRAMSPPAPHALRNRKQQRLRVHHISVKVKPAPAQAQVAPKPQAESATHILPTFAPGTSSAVTVIGNHQISGAATNDMTSTVCEPSVASRDNEVLLTGNWFAAFSTNGGSTFQYRNPFSMFPDSSQGGFCCDQVANYDKSHDLMCWALQYINNSSGNTLRLAVAHGNDIAQEHWHYYDFTPQNVGNWMAEWFDFPDLVLGDSFLYVTSNVFGTADNSFKRSVVLRLPLDKLAAYQGFDYNYHSDDNFAPRATHGAHNTMYWAVHKDLATLRIFSWPENSTSVSGPKDVGVQTWSDASRTAPGPDGRDWLGREDGRITAAWMGGGTIGFAWTAAQDSNFHYPHVRVAILNTNNLTLQSQPHIWNNGFAFAYPAAAPNGQGRVGISLDFGGNTLYPSHAVGIYGDNGKWDLVSTASGRYGPADEKWGDFLTIRPYGADPKVWVATGYTLQSGPNAGDVEVRYILFR